jgi:hypothetical protein
MFLLLDARTTRGQIRKQHIHGIEMAYGFAIKKYKENGFGFACLQYFSMSNPMRETSTQQKLVFLLLQQEFTSLWIILYTWIYLP